MNQPDTSASPYDRGTIVLHWVTAILVVALWCLGQTIDWFPRGAPKIAAISTHITGGIVLVVVLLARIFWRGSAGRHLPPVDPGMMGVLSQLVHTALYLLLIAVVSVGISLEWLRGGTLFGLFNLPGLTAEHVVLRPFTGLHGLLANALLIVAGLHALAALAHHYVLRDGVLRRMMPGLGYPGGRGR
jgi:cytochrome b561